MQVRDLACGYGCPLGGKDRRKRHILCPERRSRIKFNPLMFEVSGFIGEISKGSIKTWKSQLDFVVVAEVTITTLFYVKRYFAFLVPSLCGARQRIFPDFFVEDEDEVKKVFAKPVKRERVLHLEGPGCVILGKPFIGIDSVVWSKLFPGSCAHARFFGVPKGKEEPGTFIAAHHVAQFVPQKPPLYAVGEFDEIICSHCKTVFDTFDDYCKSCVPDFKNNS